MKLQSKSLKINHGWDVSRSRSGLSPRRWLVIFLFFGFVNSLATGLASASEPRDPSFCETKTESVIQSGADVAKALTEGRICTNCSDPTDDASEPRTGGSPKQNVCGGPAPVGGISPGCFCIAEEEQPRTGTNQNFSRLQCEKTDNGYLTTPGAKSCDNNGRIAGTLAASFNGVVKCLNAKASVLAAEKSKFIPEHTSLSQIQIDPAEAFKMLYHEARFATNEGKGGMMQLTQPAVREFESGPGYANRSGKDRSGNPASLRTSATYKMWHTPSNDKNCQDIETGPSGVPAGSEPQVEFGSHFRLNTPSACPMLDPKANPDRAFVYGLSLYMAGKESALEWCNEHRAALHGLGFNEQDIEKLQNSFAALHYNMGPGAKKVWNQYFNMLPRIVGQNPNNGNKMVELPHHLVSKQEEEVQAGVKKNPGLWNALFGYINQIKHSQQTRPIIIEIAPKADGTPGSNEAHRSTIELSSYMIEKVQHGGSLTMINDPAVRDKLEATILSMNTMTPLAPQPNTFVGSAKALLGHIKSAVDSAIQSVTKAALIENPAGDPQYLSGISKDYKAFQKQQDLDRLKGYRCNLD